MNKDCFWRSLNRSALLVSLVAGSLVLAACGGSSSNKSSSSSSSVVSSSSSSSSIVPPGSGVWPELNVTSTNPGSLTIKWSAVSGATHYNLLKNADGGSGYETVAENLTETTATDFISVHLHDWVNASYLVEACNAGSCQTSTPAFTASAMLDSIAYLKASNTDANDWFGWSLALSDDGTTLAVGAPAEDSRATGVNGDQADNSSRASGAVYVFVKQDGLWAQQAYIKASNTEQPTEDVTQYLPNDRFGYRVALSADGNRLIVSAYNEDSGAAGVNCDQGNFLTTMSTSSESSKVVHADINVGAVYVFTRNTNNEWAQEAYVKPSNTWAGTNFGHSIAVSGDGNTLVVSMPTEVLNLTGVQATSSESSVCVPANQVPSSISSTSSSSSSSSSVSTSSTSSTSSAILANGSGAVYIYERSDEGQWTQQFYVKASNTDAGDAFGASVALSRDGSTLAVGATGEDSASTGINGAQTNGTFAYRAPSAYVASNYPYNAGAVYVFRRADSGWAQQAYVKPGNVMPNQAFGVSVSLSDNGDRLAVGAPGDASRSTGVNGDAANYEMVNAAHDGSWAGITGYGAAYIFDFNGSSWAQAAYVKASNASADDNFGMNVSLSADGAALAVATSAEQSLAKGINGSQTERSGSTVGAVYVYRLDAGNWAQTSYVKPSNTRAGHRFGSSLSLSEDGKSMAVGTHRDASAATGIGGDQEDTSTPSAGAVYIY